MCVRVKNVKKWREDAQPEWPEAASGTQDIPTAGGITQTFSETDETGATGVPADEGNQDFPGAPRADRGQGAPERPAAEPSYAIRGTSPAAVPVTHTTRTR